MHQNSQYKFILLGCLAILILGVGTLGLYTFYSNPQFELIVFSSQKYPDYRKQISPLINAQTQSLSERKIDAASWDYTSSEEVAVTLIDSNNPSYG